MAQWIRHRPPKPRIAGSSPAGGSCIFCVHEDHWKQQALPIVPSNACLDIYVLIVPFKNTAQHKRYITFQHLPRQGLLCLVLTNYCGPRCSLLARCSTCIMDIWQFATQFILHWIPSVSRNWNDTRIVEYISLSFHPFVYTFAVIASTGPLC